MPADAQRQVPAACGRATPALPADPPDAAMILPLDAGALGALMPMFLWLDPDGRVRAVGPTLRKILGPALPGGAPIAGCRFPDLFDILRPRTAPRAALPSVPGRLRVRLVHPPRTSFRAEAVALPSAADTGGGGHLINLGFGIHAEDAVRRHSLTDRDFAATDLTVELLFLQEARSAVMEELRRLNARLDEARRSAMAQALTDPLTGLANRRAMDSALADCAGNDAPFGLMHVDLDRFKQVNDTFGHAAGDAVLAAAAARLQAETRDGDVVARVGGDEFVLLLPDQTDLAVLAAIAARLIARLEQPIAFDGQTCRISASVGFTASSQYRHVDVDRLLSDVDAALYRSKQAGRGQASAATGAMGGAATPG